jgi:hypothetical protein
MRPVPDLSIWTKKKQVRPGFPQAMLATRLLTGNRGGFSFGGHRLSSLYRSRRLN